MDALVASSLAASPEKGLLVELLDVSQTQRERLAWQLQGFGDELSLSLKQIAPCEDPVQLNRTDLEVLGTVTRSIFACRPVRMPYVSLSSGVKPHEVGTVALAYVGLRWHLRAFDRNRKCFRVFLLTRILNVKELSEQAEKQYASMVEMQFVPPPGIEHPWAIEAAYGKEKGCIRIKSRAALSANVLKRWNADASPDYHVSPFIYRMWLRNTSTLYGGESAAITSGMRRPEVEACHRR